LTYKSGFPILTSNESKFLSKNIDTPWQQANVAGYAAQIFCGGNWGFAELEVHAPVIKGGSHYRSHLKSRTFIMDISSSTSADTVLKNLEITK
jgi:hypothetical protein